MNRHFFQLAKRCAKQSTYAGSQKQKVGCVIVFKGSVIAKGFNSNKTHSDQERYNKERFQDTHLFPAKCHAEMMALSKIKYLDIDFSKVKVYNYREMKSGKLALSRPCPACMKAIKDLGIKIINYTTNDGYASEELL